MDLSPKLWSLCNERPRELRTPQSMVPRHSLIFNLACQGGTNSGRVEDSPELRNGEKSPGTQCIETEDISRQRRYIYKIIQDGSIFVVFVAHVWHSRISQPFAHL